MKGDFVLTMRITISCTVSTITKNSLTRKASIFFYIILTMEKLQRHPGLLKTIALTVNGVITSLLHKSPGFLQAEWKGIFNYDAATASSAFYRQTAHDYFVVA